VATLLVNNSGIEFGQENSNCERIRKIPMNQVYLNRENDIATATAIPITMPVLKTADPNPIATASNTPANKRI
jgi:hypothetical protein